MKAESAHHCSSLGSSNPLCTGSFQALSDRKSRHGRDFCRGHRVKAWEPRSPLHFCATEDKRTRPWASSHFSLPFHPTAARQTLNREPAAPGEGAWRAAPPPVVRCGAVPPLRPAEPPPGLNARLRPPELAGLGCAEGRGSARRYGERWKRMSRWGCGSSAPPGEAASAKGLRSPFPRGSPAQRRPRVPAGIPAGPLQPRQPVRRKVRGAAAPPLLRRRLRRARAGGADAEVGVRRGRGGRQPPAAGLGAFLAPISSN